MYTYESPMWKEAIIIIEQNNKVDTKESFIMFDKKFITEKQTKNRLLLIMAYLKTNSALNGSVGISINMLVQNIGYVPNTRKNRINDKVISSIKWLRDKNYISIETEFEVDKESKIRKSKEFNRLRSSDCFIIHINNESQFFNPQKNYVILTETEFVTLVQYPTVLDRQDLLNVYLNIKKFINFGGDSDKLCYPSHITLCRDCKISSTGSMNKLIDELIAIGLVYKYNSGQYKDANGNTRSVNNFYALEDKVLKPDVCDEIIKNYYSTQGIIIEKFINR